jgi:hypothetical protein
VVGVMPTDWTLLAHTSWNVGILYALAHFSTMHRYFHGGFDAKSHRVASNTQHCDDNAVVDEDLFRLLPAQDQHSSILLPVAWFFLGPIPALRANNG